MWYFSFGFCLTDHIYAHVHKPGADSASQITWMRQQKKKINKYHFINLFKLNCILLNHYIINFIIMISEWSLNEKTKLFWIFHSNGGFFFSYKNYSSFIWSEKKSKNIFLNNSTPSDLFNNFISFNKSKSLRKNWGKTVNWKLLNNMEHV